MSHTRIGTWIFLSFVSLSLTACKLTDTRTTSLETLTSSEKVAPAKKIEDAITAEHAQIELDKPQNEPVKRHIGSDIPAKNAETQQVALQEPIVQGAIEAVEICPTIPLMPEGTIVNPIQTLPPHCPPVQLHCPVPGEMPAHPIVKQKVRVHPMYPREIKTSFSSPEEYLCDGGDRNQQVKIGEDFGITGLDLEDTVAHFDTLDGQRIIQPSNRVKIYSPRFGTVRRTRGLLLNRSSEHLAGTGEKTLVSGQKRFEEITTTLQQTQPKKRVNAYGVNGLKDLARTEEFQADLHAVGFNNAFSAYENFRIIRFGELEQSDKARLAQATQKAEVWTDKIGARMYIKDQLTATTRSRSKLQEITGLEERVSKLKMRIVKVASKGEAKPGTMIEFTIRFDNLSNEEVGNVTIMDNLTPRLEFVPGSQQCSLKSDFIVSDNEGQSSLLRWEINDPIKPNSGGIIRFKCFVR